MEWGALESIATLLGFLAVVSGGLWKMASDNAKHHASNEALTKEMAALTKRVDGHDLDLKALSSIVTDVAVIKSELTHLAHDVKGLTMAVEGLRKLIQDKA